MSQNVSENDIWEYKPLKKKKKTYTEAPKSSKGPLSKYRQSSKRITKKDTVRDVKLTQVDYSKDINVKANESIKKKEVVCRTHLTQNLTSSQTTQENTLGTGKKVHQASSLEGFCPICQMPFSILVVQSQRWHVAECLDTPGDDSKECPDGLQCSSTIPNHYKRYSHSILAHTRAVSDTTLLSISLDKETDELLCVQTGIDQRANLALEESAVTQHNQSPSSINGHGGVTTTTKPNALQLLRSPAQGDIRKKKGWTPYVKGRKSTNAFHDHKTEVSAPLDGNSGYDCIEGGFVRAVASASSNEISYSPISSFVNGTQPRKSLFSSDLFEDGDNTDSVLLFTDSISSEDGLSSNLLAHSETKEVVGSPFNTDTQLVLSGSLKPNNPIPSSSEGTNAEVICNTSTASLSVQSPQRMVLERLRDHLLSQSSNSSLNSNSFYDCSGHTNTELNTPLPHVSPFSQAYPTTHQSQAPMEPRNGQAKAAVSGLKQTDIGVFFGLRPLKDKGKEAGNGNVLPDASLQQASIPSVFEENHRGLQRKGRGVKGTKTPDVRMPSDSGSTQCLSDGGRGGRTDARKRWNLGRTAGESRKRCPFYKKIPGTKFAVDAFQYGLVEGITSYFLTHFHSDHYGGLKKSSTFPIYCNRITGNLVKSKLKVAEQYVHILPMNFQVTVDGVKVTLLDANHCPGAAMLLFVLPDGQTVLHTGDFRADPSMEDYYELMSCRIQTLYLDTTYCSPEYTFPTQQEVITFAANTAFECVTLHPRTLVVCGSYSVGKEKVFLALAEVLGTKVCMSQDKFKTMCCLESERIRQLITTAWETAQVHVLPMMQLNIKNLQAHLTRFSGQYDKLVAFKPTGWTFSQGVEAVGDVRPKVQGNISIYGIPYSEHSSYMELRRFVQWIQPLKIIPTVNVGSWASRKAMERCFCEWLTEAKANSVK